MSTQTSSHTIVLTERAAQEIKKRQQEKKEANWGLKFADCASACGEGYSYVFNLVSSPETQDEIFVSQGINICVPKSSISRLQGCVIEYSGDDHIEWSVENPNAKSECPCSCGDGVGY